MYRVHTVQEMVRKESKVIKDGADFLDRLITFRGEITGEEPEFPEFRKSLPKKFDGTFLTWWTNLAIFRTWFAFVFCILTVAVFFSASWSRRGESIVNILIAWSMVC